MTEQVRKDQEGFTLVELLVALAITTTIATFATGALMLSLRAFEASRQDEVGLEARAGLSRLADLISKAWPATSLDSNTGLAGLFFYGRNDALAFATLSEGHGLEGGVIQVRLALDCDKTVSASCRLELITAIHRSDPEAVSYHDPVILARGVLGIQLRYLGASSLAERPRWHDEWHGMDRLPRAVSVEVGFADADVLKVPLIIPLHHASL